MPRADAGASRAPAVRALAAAALFGLTLPAIKPFAGTVAPFTGAGLLYFGAGLGLFGFRFAYRSAGESPLRRRDLRWAALGFGAGGVLAPVLLLLALRSSPASSISLLLNLEGALTAFLAYRFFGDHYDRRLAAGLALILGGGVALAAEPSAKIEPLSIVFAALACLAWAIDNNASQRISAADPVRIAAWKGAIAGSVNLALGAGWGETIPTGAALVTLLLAGFAGYGVSLVLYLRALRDLGAARTSAYFASGPFCGAAAAVILGGEPASIGLVVAAVLMTAGVTLHVVEHHDHRHVHDPLEHEHAHVHDEHHRHEHASGDPPGEPHSHAHCHEPLEHAHPHRPDLHHRHRHERESGA